MGTGLRTRLDQGQDQIQTDGIQTARMLSTRERVLLALRDIQRDKHGSTMKDKTASGERAIGLTENSKTSNDCVAQGTSRMMGQSFTEGQESRTTEAILALTTRMDMECQTLLPTTKGTFRFRLLELHRTRTRTTTLLVLLELLRLLGLWILVM